MYSFSILPDIIIITLKRFDTSTARPRKIYSNVIYPLRGLDMGPYLLGGGSNSEHRYDLYAVNVS
jgi:hypothetical protein